MVLQFADGRPFATGACPYWDQPPSEHTATPRITVVVKIDGFETQAVVDTGGVYFVCDPQIPNTLNLNPSAGLEVPPLRIGIDKYRGNLHRLAITLVAEKGESLELEVAAFIPRLDPGQEWQKPSFLGLQGCLEFLRFAVDPGTNAFYFGPLVTIIS
jgi:hypothetical protein